MVGLSKTESRYKIDGFYYWSISYFIINILTDTTNAKSRGTAAFISARFAGTFFTVKKKKITLRKGDKDKKYFLTL